MKIISHRGNIEGRFESWENEPTYIDSAIKHGFDAEIDVWVVDNIPYLGHDKPQYGVDFRWFRDRITRLWIHCKNMEALLYFKKCGYDANYFWHQTDDFTITSNGYFWTFPGKPVGENSIAVLPELEADWNYSDAYGVCTDYPIKMCTV